MDLYGKEDLLLTPGGDFDIGKSGQAELTSDLELIEQLVSLAVKSTNPEWFMQTFPADLEDLIGLENSRSTAEIGKLKIKDALVQLGFPNDENIWIEAKPVSSSEILFFIFLNLPERNRAVFEVGVNLEFGMSVRRVDGT